MPTLVEIRTLDYSIERSIVLRSNDWRVKVPRRADDPNWTDPGLLVMASLAEGSRHGYAIIQDVEATTGVRLGPGTLYGALSRLEQRGLIEPLESGDPRRRPYRLTSRGAGVLAERLEQMRRFASLGRKRLAASPTLGMA